MAGVQQWYSIYKKKVKLAKLKAAVQSMSGHSSNWIKALEDQGIGTSADLRNGGLTAQVPLDILASCGLIHDMLPGTPASAGFHDEDEFQENDHDIKVMFGRKWVRFGYKGQRISVPSAVEEHFIGLTNKYMDELADWIDQQGAGF